MNESELLTVKQMKSALSNQGDSKVKGAKTELGTKTLQSINQISKMKILF